MIEELIAGIMSAPGYDPISSLGWNFLIQIEQTPSASKGDEGMATGIANRLTRLPLVDKFFIYWQELEACPPDPEVISELIHGGESNRSVAEAAQAWSTLSSVVGETLRRLGGIMDNVQTWTGEGARVTKEILITYLNKMNKIYTVISETFEAIEHFRFSFECLCNSVVPLDIIQVNRDEAQLLRARNIGVGTSEFMQLEELNAEYEIWREENLRAIGQYIVEVIAVLLSLPQFEQSRMRLMKRAII